MARVLPVVVVVALFIYAFTDCVQTRTTAYLSKGVWLAVITFVPLVGPVLWLLFGRGGGWWHRDDEPRSPIDDPSVWRDFERQF